MGRGAFKQSTLSALRAFVRRWHYTIERPPCPADVARAFDTDLVIDVGANEGQFVEELRARGYAGPVVSFEPVSTALAILHDKAARDRHWSVIGAAASDRAGRLPINVSQGTDMSSFHEGNAAGLALDPRIAVIDQEMVELVRLDDVAVLHGARRPYLKIDTQGHERQVLAGCPDLLSRAVAVQLELPLINIYEGVWHFYDAMEAMRALGFVPAQFHPITWSEAIPESLVEIDCIFRRRIDADRVDVGKEV